MIEPFAVGSILPVLFSSEFWNDFACAIILFLKCFALITALFTIAFTLIIIGKAILRGDKHD